MLVDTNVLLRALQQRHPQHAVASRALQALPARGRELVPAPQNLVELWVVMTRPAGENGLGLDAASASVELEHFERLFTVLPETPGLFPIWKRLVVEHGIYGKPSHDARLAAWLELHAQTAVLTFDRSGFARFHGIEVVHPADVAP